MSPSETATTRPTISAAGAAAESARSSSAGNRWRGAIRVFLLGRDYVEVRCNVQVGGGDWRSAGVAVSFADPGSGSGKTVWSESPSRALSDDVGPCGGGDDDYNEETP